MCLFQPVLFICLKHCIGHSAEDSIKGGLTLNTYHRDASRQIFTCRPWQDNGRPKGLLVICWNRLRYLDLRPIGIEKKLCFYFWSLPLSNREQHLLQVQYRKLTTILSELKPLSLSQDCQPGQALAGGNHTIRKDNPSRLITKPVSPPSQTHSQGVRKHESGRCPWEPEWWRSSSELRRFCSI